MKENRTITQICEQCSEPYIPTRKGAQKFCAPSCRSRYWFLKQKEIPKPEKQLSIQAIEPKEGKPLEIKEEKPVSVEKMSLSGVGNAAVGSLFADGLKGLANAFQSEHNKPATKGDIEQIKKFLNKRYFPIINYQDPFNRRSFYDKETCNIVLYNEQLDRMELPITG